MLFSPILGWGVTGVHCGRPPTSYLLLFLYGLVCVCVRVCAYVCTLCCVNLESMSYIKSIFDHVSMDFS